MATLVIGGPTAVGKSSLSLEVAERMGAVIVSADAMTIYRDLDVGTAKPSVAERRGIKHFCLDVRNYDDMSRASDRAMQALGPIDCVIANAGLGHFAPVHEMSLEHWHQTIDTNLTGVFYTLKVLAESLIAHQGYFMSISSLAGTNFFAGGSAYNASKFGVTGFTQAAMLDLRSYGVKMTTIMPGSVSTYFNNHMPDDSDHWKIQKEDLGQIVVQLLSMHPRSLPSKIELRPTQPPSVKK